jgi:hypothetical protein
MVWAVDEFKLTQQLAKTIKAFASFAQFEQCAELAAPLGRQSGGQQGRAGRPALCPDSLSARATPELSGWRSVPARADGAPSRKCAGVRLRLRTPRTRTMRKPNCKEQFGSHAVCRKGTPQGCGLKTPTSTTAISTRTTGTTPTGSGWCARNSESAPYLGLRTVERTYRACRRCKCARVRACLYEQRLLGLSWRRGLLCWNGAGGRSRSLSLPLRNPRVEESSQGQADSVAW